MFLPLLEKLDALPEHVVYIGDEIKDCRAARDAGIGLICVESGMATAQDFRDEGVMSISSLGGLS